MSTLRVGKWPTSRIEAGDKVLSAADALDTTPITARLAAFRTIHQNFTLAHEAAKQALEALRTQQAKVNELGGEQSRAVEHLANLLPGDGFPRQNPFKPLGIPPPSRLKLLSTTAEVETVLALEKSVSKHEWASEDSIEAAKGAGNAARQVQKALKPLDALEKEATDARVKRDALLPAWERALKSLKQGAKAAEYDGYPGLYLALFNDTRSTKRSSSKKRKAIAPVEPPPPASIRQ